MRTTNSNICKMTYDTPSVSVHFIGVDTIICTSDFSAGFTLIEEDTPIELF